MLENSFIHVSIISDAIKYSEMKNNQKNVEFYCETIDDYRDYIVTDPEVVIAVVAAASLTLNNLIKQVFMLLREKNNKTKVIVFKRDGTEVFTKNIDMVNINKLVEEAAKAKESIEILEK